LRRRPGAARAKESINDGTRLPEQTSFAAPLCLLVRRRYGLSYDLAGPSREGVRLDGRNTERFAPGRRLVDDSASLPFFGLRFFLHGCGMRELGYCSVPRALSIIIIPMPIRAYLEKIRSPRRRGSSDMAGAALRSRLRRGLSSLRLPVSGTPKFSATGRCSIFERREEAQDPKTEMQLGRPDLEPATGKREGAGAQGHPTVCATRWAPMGTWDPQPALMGLSAWGGSIFAVSATQAICEAEQRQPMVPRARQLFANAAIAASRVGSYPCAARLISPL
jgi:hypothetical protein